MSDETPSRTERRAARVAGWVHDLHRWRWPFTKRALLPLNVRELEAQLCDIHEVFGRHGITFWLQDGTALGVYRDGGIIPYDDDVDLGAWAESRPQVDVALQDLEQRGFVVYKRWDRIIGLIRRYETTELCFSGVGPPRTDFERVRQNFFRRLEPREFLGRTFWLPAPIEEYLAFSYGDNWRVPVVDAWSNSTWRPEPERAELARRFGQES